VISNSYNICAIAWRWIFVSQLLRNVENDLKINVYIFNNSIFPRNRVTDFQQSGKKMVWNHRNGLRRSFGGNDRFLEVRIKQEADKTKGVKQIHALLFSLLNRKSIPAKPFGRVRSLLLKSVRDSEIYVSSGNVLIGTRQV